jgi:cbb3-type cytochrome oxidase subunit 3
MAANPTLSSRRYDLDWLRILAFGLLIFYHTGMFFVEWEWHIKNNVISEALEWPMRFMSQWRMPLLFMISGAACYFALRRRRAGSFARERFLRIFLPLVFGILVIVPPQIYFERLTQGHTYSYLQFYPSAFNPLKPYPEGNFSWHHLWYLAYIFVYSLVCLPLFRYWLTGKGKDQMEHITAFFARPGMVFLPALWLLAGDLVLREYWPEDTHALVDDWANHFKSLSLFLIGFLLVAQGSFIDVVARQRRVSLSVGLVTATVLYARYWVHWPEGISEAEVTLFRCLAFLNGWSWLLTILGFARTYLNFSNTRLRYANEAVYPFYILHQTVIICLAYPMINWALPVGVKFLLISLGAFGVCWLLYEGVIRRVWFLRPLFGLKAKAKDQTEVMQAVTVHQ